MKDVVPTYDLNDFKLYFHVSRGVFELILREIGGQPVFKFQRKAGYPYSIKADKQLLVVLWYLAQQESKQDIMRRFDIVFFDSCRARVYGAILSNLKRKYLAWPGRKQRTIIQSEFEEQCNISNVLGAVACCHIKITPASMAVLNHVPYKNEANDFTSMVLQVVATCDHHFTHVSCGWPGSFSNSKVLKESELWTKSSIWCESGQILGDSSFPLQPWLMTPYEVEGKLSTAQENYNEKLTSALRVAKTSLHHLKDRFQRLNDIKVVNVSSVTKTILVACVLHNTCISEGDLFEDDMDFSDYDSDSEVEYFTPIETRKARQRRDQIAKELSTRLNE